MQQCQSCGMPLHKDPNGKGGWTEKDGLISTKYCSLCYRDGDFCFPWDDVEAFKNIVEENMQKSWYGRFMRKFTRFQIPYLARWKK